MSLSEMSNNLMHPYDPVSKQDSHSSSALLLLDQPFFLIYKHVQLSVRLLENNLNRHQNHRKNELPHRLSSWRRSRGDQIGENSEILCSYSYTFLFPYSLALISIVNYRFQPLDGIYKAICINRSASPDRKFAHALREIF